MRYGGGEIKQTICVRIVGANCQRCPKTRDDRWRVDDESGAVNEVERCGRCLLLFTTLKSLKCERNDS